MSSATLPQPYGAHLGALAAAIEGRVITPSDLDYDQARVVWNGMHHARPAVIVQPASTADVAGALRFASRHGPPVAVRGGGHSVAGNGTVQDGLVIERGGGGNFGVVTRLELQAYPLGPDVLAGGFIWHQPRWAEALRAFAAWTPTLPDAMTAIVTFITLPGAWGSATTR